MTTLFQEQWVIKMNKYQDEINKITKDELYYRETYGDEPCSFYNVRKELRKQSKSFKTWENFKKFSNFVRD